MIDWDGMDNKKELGVNVILGVFLVIVKVVVVELVIFFYCYLGGFLVNVLLVLMMNVINGGVYVDNNVDFQEFMIMLVGVEIFKEVLCWGVEVFVVLGKVLKE